ncbi:hypothetical protein DTO013E5_403 [Penicillium roqueforti]|uniref:Genomic scaffold, ProqFM164S02 n=1 Tax=Penicillium roqueforti (strain FM164) TaxID=1365484 RepID=W6Q305_PENRF|nr:uncharacterized protein LCP9604111_735 [Penicillium roqueforti]CDM30953.1 unnamed protein product [Penicillium roqueforti FM164]KAF9253209.1 hypothetical protein LCP9604111_735 [Penicillium roqueforti]KAI1838726.1 hypothetical protein CBS147337_451 [Penicillium roqueforti]KAI2680382.1 hypothetical protein CBS147355_3362 [Penicillium roqueforti]KAI2691229.1 hypothetical protein LCP963914a_1430 [Penicillium roqueforti]
MLALRDQENLVNTHQTAAAAKPLNQSKPLAPKTPGKARNDENNPLAFGNRTVKGNGNRQDNGKPGNNAFMTPMVRDRAPLGMKTTNLKANNLQTPAPFGGTKQPRTNRRQSTAQKIRKAAPVTQQAQAKVHIDAAADDVPDIEYMPPKPRDLPDLPDDVTYDTTFPQFQPKNRALGLESVYGKQQVGSDGLTAKQRKFQEDSAACDRMVNDMIMKQLDDIGFESSGENESTKTLEPNAIPSKRPTTTTRHTRNVSTLRARDAVAALGGSRPTVAPRVAPIPKPRVASLASSLVMPKRHARVPSNPSSMRNTAAVVNSRTTVGYSKGRNVSSTLRDNHSQTQKPSSSQVLSPETYMQLYGPPPLDSEMWTRCNAAGCFDAPDEITQEPEEPLPTFDEDDEAQSFQLTL